MSGASGNVRAGRAFVEILLDQTKLERGLKSAQKKLKNFGSSLTSVGKSMLVTATLAAAPIAYATKTFADFDDQMRMVKAVSGATEEQFRRLTEVAEELGRTTSFTARQVAEGMTALGRMGFNPKEIEAAIPAVLNLARATGTDLSEAAETAANNMRVFGLNASQMAGVADILTATANGSAQTLTDLAEGLKMAGPQAAAAGDSITNVSAALGVLANMGIKGSLAGTALRKAYSQFAKVGVQKKLQEIGISTTDANGNLRAMPEIMADIAKHMNSLPSAERLAFAEEIFGLRGSLAGLQLGGNIDQLDEFIKRLRSVDGTAAKTAKDMDSGIGGAFRILMSALEGCQIALGKIVAEALAPYMKKITATLGKVAQWIAAHKKVVVIVLKVIAGIAAAGAALVALGLAFKAMAFIVGTLSTAFTILKVTVLAPIAAVKALIAVFTLLKTVLIAVKVVAAVMWAVLSAPATLIGIALAAVVAVVWQLTGAWDMCAKAMQASGNDITQAISEIKDIFGETWEVIKLALASGDLAGAAKVGLSALKLVWLKGLFPLKKAWFGLKNFLKDSWTITVYSILKLGNNLWYGLLMGLRQIGDALADAWNFLWDGIVDAFEATVLELQKAWIRTKGLFSSEDEVNAQIRVVEREYEDRKAARHRSSDEAVIRRERERSALNREWDRSNKAIDDAMNQEIGENRDEYARALSEATDQISRARQEWQSAMAAVKKSAAERTAAAEAARAKSAAASDATKQAGARLDMSGGGKAVGAWSAKELDAMLGVRNSAQERTAKAAEESVRQQKETNKRLGKMERSSNGAALSYS